MLKRPSSETRQVRSLAAGFGAQFSESRKGGSPRRWRGRVLARSGRHSAPISAQRPGIPRSVPWGRAAAAAVPLSSVRSRPRERQCLPAPLPGLRFLGPWCEVPRGPHPAVRPSRGEPGGSQRRGRPTWEPRGRSGCEGPVSAAAAARRRSLRPPGPPLPPHVGRPGQQTWR